MACCLTAPSHYLNQCWLNISKVWWHSLWALSQEIHQPLITKISLKIMYIKFNVNIPGANELNYMPILCFKKHGCWWIVNINQHNLWPGDTIWWHRSRSTLAQDNSLLPDSSTKILHKPTFFWLPKSMLTSHLWVSVAFIWGKFHSTQTTILCNEFENYTFKITATFPRDQWVNTLKHVKLRQNGHNKADDI